jgi:hypothetical protein
MPLYREQLDEIAKHGCQVPGCKHNHESLVYLHSRCHVSGQVDAFYVRADGSLAGFPENQPLEDAPDCLRILCGQCNKHIADVFIKAIKGFKRCHVAAPLEISYEAGSGILKIQCNECKTVLAEPEVCDEL